MAYGFTFVGIVYIRMIPDAKRIFPVIDFHNDTKITNLFSIFAMAKIYFLNYSVE